MGHGFVLRQPLLSQVAVKRLPPRIEDTASFGTRLSPVITILVGLVLPIMVPSMAALLNVAGLKRASGRMSPVVALAGASVMTSAEDRVAQALVACTVRIQCRVVSLITRMKLLPPVKAMPP